ELHAAVAQAGRGGDLRGARRQRRRPVLVAPVALALERRARRRTAGARREHVAEPALDDPIAHAVQVAAGLAQRRLDDDDRAALAGGRERPLDDEQARGLVELVEDRPAQDQIGAARRGGEIAQRAVARLDRDAAAERGAEVGGGGGQERERRAVAIDRGDLEIDRAPGVGQERGGAEGHGAGAGAEVEDAQRRVAG